MPPALSVIIVNWNTRAELERCLSSIFAYLERVSPEVIVVDNASTDGSREMVAARFPEVVLVGNEENVGFGRANNQAMRIARGRRLLLLNSDTELIDDGVVRLLEEMDREPQIGVAHCRLVYPDGRTQWTAYRFPSLRLAVIESFGLYKLLGRRRAGEMLLGGYWDCDRERDVDWVAGAFMLLPREVFEQTGGFDESIFMYGEDLEWCYRIRDHGWRIRFYPQVSVIHADHTSADLRWGDERVTICLINGRDVFRRRRGRGRADAAVLAGCVGSLLRTAYYGVRRLAGPRASDYAPMYDSARRSLRVLAAMAIGRR